MQYSNDDWDWLHSPSIGPCFCDVGIYAEGGDTPCFSAILHCCSKQELLPWPCIVAEAQKGSKGWRGNPNQYATTRALLCGGIGVVKTGGLYDDSGGDGDKKVVPPDDVTGRHFGSFPGGGAVSYNLLYLNIKWAFHWFMALTVIWLIWFYMI